MISIIAVGKKHEDWVLTGIERYQKRLKKPFLIDWVLLPHSTSIGAMAKKEESERIHKRLSRDSYVVLLDESGISVSSTQLSETLVKQLNISRPVVIIIGGAYGVDDELHRYADIVISLSELVFPHQLVRLILTEQLYRAQQIALNGKYHHE